MITTQKGIACIGAGNWGRNIVRNFAEIGALSWICEPDPDKRRALQAEYTTVPVTDGLGKVIRASSTAGVAIATPSETHAALVRQALFAGKHVLVEKPLCLSTREGEELVALAEKKSLILMVGHLLWYHPAILKLRELVEEGELGRI